MGVDHSAGSTAGTTALDDPTQYVTVREADDERDAFYLAHLWNRWFGTEYEHGHRYFSGRLPYPLCLVAGWEVDDAETEHLDAYGAVAEHDPPDRDGPVHVGGGLATIDTPDKTIEHLPDGGFHADALVSERNAWLWFGIVDDAWRGLGIGRRLFEDRLQWACNQGADMAFAYGWEHDGRTSRPLFEANGFVPIERFERLYEGERDVCPNCGVWPSDDELCTCSGVVWAKDL